MNILQWATDNAVNMVAVGILGFTGSWLITKLIKSVLDNFFDLSTNYIKQNIMKVPGIKTYIGRRIALEVVKSVEHTLTGQTGESKKKAAVKVLKKLIPVLSESDADELIEYSVSKMNSVLKIVQKELY